MLKRISNHIFILLFPTLYYLIELSPHALYINGLELLTTLIISTTVAVLLYIIGLKIYGHKSTFSILFFYLLLIYAYTSNIIQFIISLNLIIWQQKYYVFFVTTLIILGYTLYKTLHTNPKRRTTCIQYLNMLVIVLIVYQSALTLYNLQRYEPPLIEKVVLNTKVNCEKPNIHLILFDGYSGNVALRNYFKYDNKNVLMNLENKGFHVFDSMKSNYNYTIASLSSILNMNYINRDAFMPLDIEYVYKGQKMINNNALTTFLKEIGYHINNQSIFSLNDTKNWAKYEAYLSPIEFANKKLLHNLIIKEFKWMVFTNCSNNNFLYKKIILPLHNQNLQLAKNAYSIKTSHNPSFTYTHLMLPHDPIFTDSNGHLLEYLGKGDHNSQDNKYLNYLKYSNKIITTITDSICTKDPKSIILIMSDHGYRDFSNASYIDYFYNNFMALKLPAGRTINYEKVTSTINIFPAILNEFYQQNIPMKKDSFFLLDDIENKCDTRNILLF